MTTLTAVADTAVQGTLAELRDAVAHQVAAALEAGGATWQVSAPLVEDLLGGRTAGLAPVVVARAVGRALAAQAAAATRDPDAAAAVLARLRRTHERLADVLAR